MNKTSIFRYNEVIIIFRKIHATGNAAVYIFNECNLHFVTMRKSASC